MPYVDLPRNIEFTPSRYHDACHDSFDIKVDGKVVHTFKFDVTSIKGSSSEEFVVAEAHKRAKNWLRSQHMLPIGQ
jgi:hypothetical protein